MTARKQVIPCLAAGVAAALALGACGGDGSPEQSIPLQTETQATAALSKTEFIDEADSRCEEVHAAIAKMVEAGEGYTGSAEIADLRESLLQDLKDLGPPTDDRATLDQYLTALELQAEAGQKIGLGIERDEDTTQFETDLADAQADAQTAADKYGFKECGSEITATDSSGTTGSSGSVPVTPAPAPAPAPAPDGGGGSGGGGVGIP